MNNDWKNFIYLEILTNSVDKYFVENNFIEMAYF